MQTTSLNFRFFVLICLTSLSFSALAQKGFEIGPAFQVQSTWMLNKADFDEGPELDFKNTIRFSYGGLIGYGFSNLHGIRTGVMISQQGQEYVSSTEFKPLPGASYRTMTEYMSIPVLYRYNGELQMTNSSFLLTVGPQFGMLQSARSTSLIYDKDNQTAELSPEFDSKARLNELDISAHLGIGLIARFSKHLHMNVALNLNYSLTDIESASTKLTDRPITRNAVGGVQISLFYLMGGNDMALKLAP